MQVDRPKRVRHTYVQHLAAPPETVFPLLCPVREIEWVRGWNPSLVLSESGVAEAGCIFVTRSPRGDSTWTVTRYEPPRSIAFVKHTPGDTMGFISIDLRPDGESRTEAEVTYAYTALSTEGERSVEEFTAEHYTAFMQRWESALNHFLRTGAMLPAQPA